MGGDCRYHVLAAPVSGFFPEGTKNRMPMDKGNKDSEGVKKWIFIEAENTLSGRAGLPEPSGL